MLKPVPTSRYERDVKRLRQRGADVAQLFTLVDLLLAGKPLPSRYKDHQLVGTLEKFRDAHVNEPDDWVLVYRVLGGTLVLARTGTHEEVFKRRRRKQQ